MLCPIKHPEAAVPQCDGDFGGVGAVLVHAEGAKLLKIWSPLEGVDVANRAGSASVTGSVTWDARGLGNRNLTLSVCAAERNWSVVINRLGRPRRPKHGECVPTSSALNRRYPVCRSRQCRLYGLMLHHFGAAEIRYPSPPDFCPGIPRREELSMKICMAQIITLVGDIAANAQRV